MDYKKAFLSKLQDCYLGVKIKDFKDKSGFSNLLDIKEKYFSNIKNYLESRIKNNESDIYNKLYTFFDSYLNDTGTPFFNQTPIYKNIYAKVYSNSKDTSLFYKTQNLFYVKSDMLYKDLTISDKTGIYEFIFDASDFIQASDNAKNKVVFKLNSIDKETKQINIKITNQKALFENLINVFKINSNDFREEFLKELKYQGFKIDEDELKKIFTSYKKQNEIDFFIHKNAKNFLEEQFDLWMFSHLYKDSQIHQWDLKTIEHLQNIRNIAYGVIKLIGDFEDELKALWLKPKFAKKVQYVFSMDLIKRNISNDVLDSILKDSKFEFQLKEWIELKLIDESFDKNEILSSSFLNNEKYKFLPLDTKHLSKKSYFLLLSSFGNLESLLNGELIKSDNFQALNSLMPKYKDKIDLIYIDPPFNTGSDFEYKDGFQDSTWLSLMHNRLELAKELLSDKGSIYLHLDYNANYRGRELLNEIFGKENFINEIVWSYGSGGKSDNFFGRKHDNIWFYSKKNYIFNFTDIGEVRGSQKKNNMKKNIDKDGRVYMSIKSNGKIYKYYEDELITPNDVWNLSHLQQKDPERIQSEFNLTQKPEALLQRIIKASSNKNSIVVDFFAGSGTSIASALKLNRKFLGVEMGEHFYDVIIPRMKKVIAGFKSGISKELEYQGGGAFRYYELESYEEALCNCEYVLNEENYIIDYNKSRKLIKNLNKGEFISLDMNDEYRKDFDIFQTISNIYGGGGWNIKRLFLDANDMESCEFENGEILNLNTIDLVKYPKLKNLIWWEKLDGK